MAKAEAERIIKRNQLIKLLSLLLANVFIKVLVLFLNLLNIILYLDVFARLQLQWILRFKKIKVFFILLLINRNIFLFQLIFLIRKWISHAQLFKYLPC